MTEESLPAPGARRATVVDVAAKAGVSRQTVTRAMNDMPGISLATKTRVIAAAKELKYRPSRFGRGLVLGHQLTLGLVLDDLSNPYYSELAASVISTAADRGWNVVVADTAHSPHSMASALRSLVDQIDAIVGYIRVPPEDFDLVFGDMPVVALESKPAPGQRGVVEIDFGPGMRAAVGYLHGSGRRRIVMVDVGKPEDTSDRDLHYREAMTNLGLDSVVFHTSQSAEGGLDAIQTVLAQTPDVDAIIAFNDIVAFGIMKGLAQAGVSIPVQCAVLGIDGLAIGKISTPELSSLALDLSEIGRLGVEMAIRMHAGELPASGPILHRKISHSLLLRESA